MYSPTLLTRDEFREGVFRRDSCRCVICGLPADDAHHIMERRLFDNGGYFLENGVALCSTHHLEAEQTLINPSEFYSIIGAKRIIPDDFYEEYQYTKWGDIILHNQKRIQGPLFHDESVQKILKAGGVADRYLPYIKYPRSLHLPWSESKAADDRTLTDVSHFGNKEVVVTLKMDGENTTIYSDGYFHDRSIDAEAHFTQSWARNLASRIAYEMPTGWRICGENLWAVHSIPYSELESYFYVFSIWNQKNQCLPWDETKEWCQLLGLKVVDCIYDGVFNESFIKESFFPYKNSHEGYVVRIKEGFSYGKFKRSLAKFVRSGHVQSSKHWKWEKIKKNELRKST